MTPDGLNMMTFSDVYSASWCATTFEGKNLSQLLPTNFTVDTKMGFLRTTIHKNTMTPVNLVLPESLAGIRGNEEGVQE